jgi:ABC-2 type transport system permease protein
MIVGAMLTSLVVAREYENGTMKTIRSLPVPAAEFLTGYADEEIKLLPLRQ